MTESLKNIPDELQPPGSDIKDAPIPTVVDSTGFGELVVGNGDIAAVQMTALCLLDAPAVNKFLLGSNLRFSDRLTGTRIFPRENMSLPNGETYVAPKSEDE
jgi:hypothetical protein